MQSDPGDIIKKKKVNNLYSAQLHLKIFWKEKHVIRLLHIQPLTYHRNKFSNYLMVQLLFNLFNGSCGPNFKGLPFGSHQPEPALKYVFVMEG